jgi:hypothetical protein
MRNLLPKLVAAAALAALPSIGASQVDLLGSSPAFGGGVSNVTFNDFIGGVVDATFTSAPGAFAQKTDAGVTGVGVAGGPSGAEIDIGQSITVSFSNPVLLPALQLAFLFDGPEFGDVLERAQVTATLMGGGTATGTLTTVNSTTANWGGTGFGTASNLSPATEAMAGLWRVANPFGPGFLTSLQFTALAGVCGSGLCNNQSDYSIERITVAIPEPETYAMLIAGLLAAGWIIRRRRPVA